MMPPADWADLVAAVTDDQLAAPGAVTASRQPWPDAGAIRGVDGDDPGRRRSAARVGAQRGLSIPTDAAAANEVVGMAGTHPAWTP